MERESKKLLCPVCEKKEALFFVRKNNCNLYRCQNCGLIFVWPIAPDYSKIYQKNYFFGSGNSFGYADYDGDREILLRNFKQYTAKLDRFCPRKGKLLDVGAATGIFVELIARDGWIASGIEPAKEAAEVGRKNKLNIMNGNFETADFVEDNFDVITFWDVLEHFSDSDAVLKKTNKILSPGGLIAINTPDASSFLAKFLGRRWHLIVPPEHLALFGRRSLEILLQKNGFDIVHVDRIGKKFSLRYIFKVLANYQKFFLWRKMADCLANNFIGKISIPLNMRDNIFVIARKKRKLKE